ncbi:hypothetical protein SAY86_001253 [Trapa natans]|uniref:CRIB domain-containing protein n=1 Tax=Trapa natans TaxID=22666 RepID=A0AAN7MVR6_TRANT|nr:hypothetical protein SAY86_001253 [Trapa natans]
MSTKMKGIFKGLRYISQIFEEEKEQEMVIGLPTDVKHVAHIGMDGPSNTPPSWMNEYKQADTEGGSKKEASDPKPFESNSMASEGSCRRRAKAQGCHGSPGRDLPEVPKPSRRHSSSTNGVESPTKAKSERRRHSRHASKGSSPGRDFLVGVPSDVESESGLDSPHNLPAMPKKTRRKKSKETTGQVRRSKLGSEASAVSSEVPVLAPQNHCSSSLQSVE